MTTTNSATVTIGRLLEIRAEAGFRTPEDIDAVLAAIMGALGRLPGEPRCVAVVDWRRCPIMSPEASTHMVRRMTELNENLERSAIVVSANAPSAVLQFARVIRDADHPSRRMFFDADEAIAFLDAALTLEERARLRWFLEKS